MAFWDDWSVNVAGDIRHESGTTHYTGLELHRALGDLADNASSSGDDLVDITSDTPSERSTDQIISLLGTYNIDDAGAEFLYGCSISQDNGNTIYSGLQVLGAVNASTTQLQIIQDNALYDGASPFWGDQSTGGYNGNATAGILMRCLVKSRENGADINGKRVRVQARHWGDSYDFFDVTLGLAESVAAISTTPDPQNDTSQGTVTAYTHVVNSGGTANAPTGGYQTIDLNNGGGSLEYYSKWTYGADTSGDGLKGVWEYLKDLVGNTTSKTCDGVNGELFLGVTHALAYDNESAGPFTEREEIVWGTDVTYDTLAGGTFSAGDYVVFTRASVIINAGRVLYDNGSTQMKVALEDTSTALADGDIIAESSAGSVTAAIDTTIVNDDKAGGRGILLALDDDGATGNLYFQLIHGASPADNLPIQGITSSATCDAAGAAVAKTISKMFLGSYTGSLIGAYGIGIDEGDLSASDSITPLVGSVQIPPNNVTWTISGLVSGEDYVLVGPKDTGNDIEKDQLTLDTTLNGGTETAIIATTAIPSDTPATNANGGIRVELDTGNYRKISYTSWTGSTFTVASSDWIDPDDATAGNNIFIAYLDGLASGTSMSFTSIYSSARDLWVRVRDGGSTPIKTFQSPSQLTSGGGGITAIRTSDA